ncbi:DoxX family protein [Flavobacterium sp. NRK1]|uniref:DoxX family protein n=1 Tax=Flavobacterium sp. NRK1 TaxID=2954929 RepID=UPI00209395C1|nr:DoxX family protein [Flavobacterium sp. NRK1]MCO6148956.1 DoxX family protein [Flavobacterium sp. NRK1]
MPPQNDFRTAALGSCSVFYNCLFFTIFGQLSAINLYQGVSNLVGQFNVYVTKFKISMIPCRKLSLTIITTLYILLFVYAAVSKLLDFQDFRIQLGQSPLLSAFAGWLWWLVPLLELTISFLLATGLARTIALFAAYTLMVMFTAYIYIMINYSSYTPCSCGGVLEKLSWKSHLIFNLCFTALGLVGIALIPKSIESKSTL